MNASTDHTMMLCTPLSDRLSPTSRSLEPSLEVSGGSCGKRCLDVSMRPLSSRVCAALRAGRPPWRCPPTNRALFGSGVNRAPPAFPPPVTRRVVRRRENTRDCDRSAVSIHVNASEDNYFEDGEVFCNGKMAHDDENPGYIDRSSEVLNKNELNDNYDSGSNRGRDNDDGDKLHIIEEDNENDIAMCMDNDISHLSGSPCGTMDGWPGSCGTLSEAGHCGRNAERRLSVFGEMQAHSPLRSSITAEVDCGYYNSHKQKQQCNQYPEGRRETKKARSSEKRSERGSKKERQTLGDVLEVLYNAATGRTSSSKRVTSSKHRASSRSNRRELRATESCAAVLRQRQDVQPVRLYETHDASRRSRRSGTVLDSKTIEAVMAKREHSRVASSRHDALKKEICSFIKSYRMHVPSPALTWVEVEAPTVYVSEDEGMLSLSKVPSISSESSDAVVEMITFTITDRSNEPKLVPCAGFRGNDAVGDAGGPGGVSNPKANGSRADPPSLLVEVPSARLSQHTVRYLKEQVERQSGISAAKQVLQVGSVVLRDDVPLSFLHPSLVIYLDKDENVLGKAMERKVAETSSKFSEVASSERQWAGQMPIPQAQEQQSATRETDGASQQLQQSQALQQQQALEKMKERPALQLKSETQQQQRPVEKTPTSLSRSGTVTNSPVRPRRPAPSPFPNGVGLGVSRVASSLSAPSTLNVTQASLLSCGKTPTATPCGAASAAANHTECDPVAQLLEGLYDDGEMLEDVMSSTIEQMRVLENIQRNLLRS